MTPLSNDEYNAEWGAFNKDYHERGRLKRAGATLLNLEDVEMEAIRAGSGCLNRLLRMISGASAGFGLPRSATAG